MVASIGIHYVELSVIFAAGAAIRCVSIADECDLCSVGRESRLNVIDAAEVGLCIGLRIVGEDVINARAGIKWTAAHDLAENELLTWGSKGVIVLTSAFRAVLRADAAIRIRSGKRC